MHDPITSPPPETRTRWFEITIPRRGSSQPPHSFTRAALLAALPTLVSFLGAAAASGLLLLAVSGTSPADAARSYLDAGPETRTSIDISLAIYFAAFAAAALLSIALQARRQRWTRHYETLDIGYTIVPDTGWTRSSMLTVERLPDLRAWPDQLAKQKTVASIHAGDDRYVTERDIDRAIHADLTLLKADLVATTNDPLLPAATERIITTTGAAI
jgi:hypothetical protein